MTGEKWIDYARLLAEVPSTSIEIVKYVKFQEEMDTHGSSVPGSTVFTYLCVVTSCVGLVFGFV